MLTTLHIKNMVCNRCIKVVNDVLTRLDVTIDNIELGKVTTSTHLSIEKRSAIKSALEENGFELLDDKKSQLIDKIKTLIIASIHHHTVEKKIYNMSDYIASEVGHDYSYLSNLFSSVEGLTIEKYIILQKIEKVKELLDYNEFSLKEISYQMGYSSVQHLSNQFKKITGLTPTGFKNLRKNDRKPLDKV